MDTPSESRRLSGALLLGMLVCPILFCWFFLRRGYAKSTRAAAFTYTAATLSLRLLGAISQVI